MMNYNVLMLKTFLKGKSKETKPKWPNKRNCSHFFGEYADRFLGLCNETFSTLYKKVFKRYWHDGSFLARMSCNYAVTDWQNGSYEVYIPTRENPAYNMDYFRIAVKVLPEIDYEIARSTALQLQKPQITPMGEVDSELQVIVAPKLMKRGFIRGFKHVKKPGFLTAVVVSKVPEIAFKRILVLVAKFIETRLDKLLEKLNFQPWQYDYNDKKKLYYIYLRSIVERFSHSLALTIRSFSHVLAWVTGKIKAVLHEIGLQNMAKAVTKPLLRLSKKDKTEVLNRIKTILTVETKANTTCILKHIVTTKHLISIEDKKDVVLDYLYALAKAKPVPSEPPKHYHKIHQHGEVLYI